MNNKPLTNGANDFVGGFRKKNKARFHRSKILDEFFAPDFKTLVHKKTGEYATYMQGYMFTGEIPYVLAKTATIAKLKKYHKAQLKDKCDVINWKDYKMIGITIVKHPL